jgi:hypothetical protein
MSNTLAIAAVTATLRDLLTRVVDPLPIDPSTDNSLTDTDVTTKPIEKAREAEGRNQLNIFLYQITPSAAFRNMEMPGTTHRHETGPFPLALDLHYLLTAYGASFDELRAQRVLGRAMSLLHDNAVLSAAALKAALADNDLALQPERVRITPRGMTAEEISKLWSAFQTPYRLSVAYDVSVVLIHSAKPLRAAPPVLTRDITARPSLVPPFAALTSIKVGSDPQPAARLPFNSAGPPAVALPGDTLVFSGHDLIGTSLRAEFSHRLLASPQTIDAATFTPSGFSIALPDDQSNWPVGMYSISASLARGTPERINTASIPLPIAPRIISITPSPAIRDANGDVTFTVRLSPEVWPEQRAVLLVGSTEFPAEPHAAKTDQLQFRVAGMAPDRYWMRVRVDGVDSFLIQYDATPLALDPNLRVEIQ